MPKTRLTGVVRLKFWIPTPVDTRLRFLADCVKCCVGRGGGKVVDQAAPGVIAVQFVASPWEELPDVAGRRVVFVACGMHPTAMTNLDLPGAVLVYPSPSSAAVARDVFSQSLVCSVPPPFDCSVYARANRKANFDWNYHGYRLYSVVTPAEVGIVYPLLRLVLAEYRATDDVSLLLYVTADRAEVQRVVNYAVEESGLVKSRRPKVTVCFGEWSPQNMAALALYGDCALLPYAGCDTPLEVLFALGAGNFVAAPEWSAGGVLCRRSGVFVPAKVKQYAEIDWESLARITRQAVAAGRRERKPAEQAAARRDCASGNFYHELLANLWAVPD